MRYRIFGRTGLRVSEFCLGTMTFGEAWGWGASPEGSKEQFEAFVAAGGNFFDTANYYTGGASETILGELIRPDRERHVVATKFTLGMRRGDLNAGGNHRKNLVHSVEASLKRLQLDYIDLLWVHAWDFTTPVAELMRALDDLVRVGKVLHLGVSDTPAWIVAQANTLAEQRGWTPFSGLQIEYSLIQRTPERDLLPMAEAFGMTVTPWSPLASGLLSGKYSAAGQVSAEGGRLKEGSARFSTRNLQIVETLRRVADDAGLPPAQVALAWIRHQQPTASPIIGARKLSQLQDNLASLSVTLSPEHLARLNEVSKIEPGFPHDFLASDNVVDIIFGGARTQLDL